MSRSGQLLGMVESQVRAPCPRICAAACSSRIPSGASHVCRADLCSLLLLVWLDIISKCQLLGSHDGGRSVGLLHRLDLLGIVQLHHRCLSLRCCVRPRIEHCHTIFIRCRFPTLCDTNVRVTQSSMGFNAVGMYCPRDGPNSIYPAHIRPCHASQIKVRTNQVPSGDYAEKGP